MPPLFSSVTTPSTMSLFSAAASISSQALPASRRFLDRRTTPSPSLTWTTIASIWSPTLTASSGLTLGSPEKSSSGMYAVCFVPRSTSISVEPTAITVPVTLSPLFKVLRDCSRSSAKFSSIAVSTFSSSLILLFTSLIIHDGVDAPAVIPTVFAPEKRLISRSSA